MPVIVLLLLIISCQKEKQNDPEQNLKLESSEPVSRSKQLIQRIANTYNIAKYKSESYLKYSFDFTLDEKTYAKGVMKYSIVDEDLNVRIEGKELNISKDSIRSEQEYFLFELNEIYTLPFIMNEDSFKLITSNDSIVTSSYSSKISNITYELSTHPLTEILQDVKSNGGNSVLNGTRLKFDKYITVNRIPVSMLWEIYNEDEVIGNVKISRISYPKA